VSPEGRDRVLEWYRQAVADGRVVASKTWWVKDDLISRMVRDGVEAPERPRNPDHLVLDDLPGGF
jgi:hypothetical protein